jgi:hypothetical protein
MQKSGKAAIRRGRRGGAGELQEAHRQRHQVHPALGEGGGGAGAGLGTMIGWKRIVVTVGEKIGKDHLTYGRARRPRSPPWSPSARPIGSACR